MSNTFYHRQDKPILYLSAGQLTGEYIGDVVFYVGVDDNRTMLVPIGMWEEYAKRLKENRPCHFYEDHGKVHRLQKAILRGLSFNIVKWVDDTIPF